MKILLKKIAVIPNKNKDLNLEGTKQIVDMIMASGIEALLENEYRESGINARYVDKSEFAGADMLVVLGGDGTILTAAREYGMYNVPLLGINHGRLGFLAEIEKTDTDSFLKVIKGEYNIAYHMMLKVKIGDLGFCALNDAVIHRGGFSRMLEFSLSIDKKHVTSILADGLIISTPTGSTAYSLSAGGPIADPALEVLIVTPICSHDLHSRSIILPSCKDVQISLKGSKSCRAYLALDGQNRYDIKGEENIIVSGGDKIGLVRTNDSSFYEKLRMKFYNKQNGG